MKAKRILVALLVASLLLPMLLTTALAEAPVKLTGLIAKHPLTKELATMEWLKQVEKEAGVEITWQEISADWDQIKSTMFASGDIPDILINATNNADYTTYVGLFENLSPWISVEKTPNLYAFFQAHPEAQAMATLADGSMYGTPKYQRFWPSVATSMYINKTWLDNLGLAVPTTWDELKAVLIAFRDGDPNGNGDTADEFPFDFLQYVGQYHPTMLLGSTGIQLADFFQDGYFVEDGIVKCAYTDPRFKELVLFLKDLWAEGLIDPEAFSNDYSKYQSIARGTGKTAKVGVTWGWEITDRVGLELADQYITLPPLKVSKDDTRDVRVEYDKIGLNYDGNRAVISTLSENKEAAIRFLDKLYNPEVGIQVLWGGMNDVDKCIAKNSDGSYTILPPADEKMDWGTWKWTSSFADLGPIYVSDDMVINLGKDMVDTLAQRAAYDEYVAKIDPKKDLFIERYMKYSIEDQSNLGVNQANINSVAQPTMVAWITGAQDIGAEWDAYVENLNASGLTQNLQIKQAAYDAWLAAQK